MREDLRGRLPGFCAAAGGIGIEGIMVMTQDMTLGKKIWAIADGYIPAWSNGPAPEMTSHEAACILNADTRDAQIELTIYFSDRGPAGPFKLRVGGQRTLHIRFNELSDPERIPTNRSYSAVFVSDVAVVIQHTRLDSRQDANALLSTIAYSE